ncbi:hypothetical protein AURDEDRAFT_123403 [Auricularia subglabra TFB-10046 SS5]|nr:hypothetical protein AURDEDRAFT_123403 [Auricularia subglabra TFB-10046 SS5]
MPVIDVGRWGGEKYETLLRNNQNSTGNFKTASSPSEPAPHQGISEVTCPRTVEPRGAGRGKRPLRHLVDRPVSDDDVAERGAEGLVRVARQPPVAPLAVARAISEHHARAASLQLAPDVCAACAAGRVRARVALGDPDEEAVQAGEEGLLPSRTVLERPRRRARDDESEAEDRLQEARSALARAIPQLQRGIQGLYELRLPSAKEPLRGGRRALSTRQDAGREAQK